MCSRVCDLFELMCMFGVMGGVCGIRVYILLKKLVVYQFRTVPRKNFATVSEAASVFSIYQRWSCSTNVSHLFKNLTSPPYAIYFWKNPRSDASTVLKTGLTSSFNNVGIVPEKAFLRKLNIFERVLWIGFVFIFELRYALQEYHQLLRCVKLVKQ